MNLTGRSSVGKHYHDNEVSANARAHYGDVNNVINLHYIPQSSTHGPPGNVPILYRYM